MIDELIRRQITIQPMTEAFPFPFPFRVTVDDYDDAQDGTQQFSVSIQTGYVNDTEALFAYKKINDERGWVMPADYPQATQQGTYALRSSDEDDPPFLVLPTKLDVTTTQVGLSWTAPDLVGWNTIKVAVRPDVFKTANTLQKDLYMRYVVLLNGSSQLADGTLVRPQEVDVSFSNITGYGISASATSVFWGYGTVKGSNSFDAISESLLGVVEIARIYMLRDPDTGTCEIINDYIDQRVTWCIGAGEVLFSADGNLVNLPAGESIDDYVNDANEAALQEVNGAVDSLINTTQYWTV